LSGLPLLQERDKRVRPGCKFTAMNANEKPDTRVSFNVSLAST